MRIGIVSMQRVANYGSFLQAFALKGILEQLGHSVEFIDYKPRKPIVPYSKWALIKHRIRIIPIVSKSIDLFNYFVRQRRDFRLLYRFVYLKDLKINYIQKYKCNVDAVVIGSDEVFNCTQAGVNVGFSPMLFGEGFQTNKIISYAGSFGYTKYEDIEQYHINTRLEKLFGNFTSISVRDQNSQNIVSKLGFNSVIHLDPVLVFDFLETSFQPQISNYAILYTYYNRQYSAEEIEEILHFCKKNSLKLVSFGRCQKWVPIKMQVKPIELLSYFQMAKYIITDTFHGAVIAIKYNKKFACIVRDNNTNKLTDLLKRLEQKDRIIKSFKDLQENYDQDIDYENTNRIIGVEKKRSVQYLEDNL